MSLLRKDLLALKIKSILRTRLGWILTTAFAFVMFMAVGPGVLLVNRPDTFIGLPLLYAWGVFWYLVIVVIALAAYRFVWSDDRNSKRVK